MCLSCGCCLPNDDHGNVKNITYSDLLMAAIAGSVPSPAMVLKNMVECYGQMAETGSSDSSYSSPVIDADKGDVPGTVPNDPNYLKNNTQYVK